MPRVFCEAVARDQKYSKASPVTPPRGSVKDPTHAGGGGLLRSATSPAAPLSQLELWPEHDSSTAPLSQLELWPEHDSSTAPLSQLELRLECGGPTTPAGAQQAPRPSSPELATFTCSDVKTEYNKTAAISCIGSKKITNVVVKRCENCNKQNSCLETFINTWTGKDSSEKGRIQLVLQHNVSELHIQEVKATDQGGYKWYIYSDAGEDDGCITLEITAPEIEPILTRNGRKLACLSSIGHRERQIHWFDGHGTNLTGSASLVSEEAEGGLTSLTSTLHEKPTLTASEYCCTVLYDVHTKRNKTKCIRAHKAVTDYLRFTSTPGIRYSRNTLARSTLPA
ncbi:uncharacterized protein LOC128847877 [Malaclemys terrapin pileata]|uniref:uncharacterized protein LOC128847877 n=1 Tax=Malaclemys terrapin pileata TaxID=2991368 RepID=UPI0023A871A0|nr:uncharacterized protein LOC128847877 [Malaclemys terrapin pileata]